MKTIHASTAAPLCRKSARILVGSIAALVLAGSFAAPCAQAANQTWDGGEPLNGNWSTIENWVGDLAAPGDTISTTNPDVATFNAAIANTWGDAGTPIVIDSPTQNIGSINFGAAAGNYFIGATAGNSLLLSSGGTIQILNTLTGTDAVQTINAPLVIQGAGGTYTFTNNSANGSGAGAGTLDIGGAVTGEAAGATVLNLSGSNTNDNTISGVIGNGTATSLAINKSGTGTWNLTGKNTYTDVTTINAGELQISGTGNLTGGNYTGNIVNNGTLRYSSSENQKLSGIISGSGSLIKDTDGGSTLTLAGTSTYTGKTIIQAGTLQIGNMNGSDSVAITNAGVAGPLGAPTGANATIDLHNDVIMQMGSTDGPGGRVNQVTDRTINLAGTGAGTVSLKVNDNDTSFTFGAVTATGTGAKTLALFTGYKGNGDREKMTFNGAISEASAINPLSLQVTFTTGNTSIVNLNAGGTFTGPIDLLRGNVGGMGYLTIGGQLTPVFSRPTRLMTTLKSTA